MLLEEPDEVVTRSAIRATLWPDDTLVEFDQSINSAVKALRVALGESAGRPVYIETLVKRGYRFRGRVEFVAGRANGQPVPRGLAPGFSAAAPAPAPVRATAPEDALPVIPQAVPPSAPPKHAPAADRRITWRWVAATMIAACAGGATGLIARRTPPVDLPPQHPIPLTTFPGLAIFPSFSPDGDRVAFSWVGPPRNDNLRPLNIYVKPVGNGDPVAITSGSYDDRLPQWSPDGTLIAFQRTVPGGHALMMIPSGGGQARKIADMGIGLAWSPDGKEIAYIAPYPPSGSGGLVVRSLATGKTRQLTHPDPYAEGLVAWSPDGRQIAFSRTITQAVNELFVIPSAGGKARQLTFDKKILEGFAWAPDSPDLVFVSHRDGEASLWRIPAAGGTPERIIAMAHRPSYPAVSAHSHRLAFTDASSDSNIWSYERAGAGSSDSARFRTPKCVICSTVEDDTPRFSPDGRKLVFVSKRTGADELWLSDAGGSYPIQLTSIGGAPTGSPRWSPDGRWIAFDSHLRGSPDVFVISAEGGAPRQLTSELSSETVPSWSHDGRWIYFTSNRGGSSQIWKVPFQGGAAVQVTRGTGSEAIESPDGMRLYYFRNDRDGLWTVPVAGGAEDVVPELRNVKPTRAWTVQPDGIYFYEDGPAAKHEVRFLNFATRGVNTLLEPSVGPLRIRPGIDISPDRRVLLYTQTDQKVENLMLIDNFR